MARSAIASLLLFTTVATAVFNSVAATEYTVGAPNGAWNLQTNFTAWVSSKSFKIGDSLLFTYNSSFHNVLEVNEADYSSCSNANPIATYNNGKTSIKLNVASNRYFICGFGNHCTLGMKIEISVAAKSPSSSSSPSPSPSAKTPAGSPSTKHPTTSPTAPPPSGAAGLTATAALAACVVIMAMAL